MSQTAREAAAQILYIMETLPDIMAVRLLGIAEGMGMANGNAARDQPDGGRAA